MSHVGLRWAAMRRFVFLVVLLAAACDRSPSEPPGRPSTVAREPVRRAPTVQDTSYRLPGGDRIVAFGDVHGDVGGARAVLRLAGVIDDKDAWIGKKTIVVQTGDQLDRGDTEPEVLDLFDDLAKKAKAAGGRFYALNGNHEVMNVSGDFRYVTEDGFLDWKGVKPTSARSAQKVDTFAELMRGRAAAFLPGGPVAVRLAQHPVAIVVGETAFVHGGILPGHVEYGIARLNRETSEWMQGKRPRMPALLASEASPIWNRSYSEGEPSERSCRALERALELLKAKRMVVGHTVQKQGITSACGDKVWRIDVGLAKVYGGKPAALEIRGAAVKALTEKSSTAPPVAAE